MKRVKYELSLDEWGKGESGVRLWDVVLTAPSVSTGGSVGAPHSVILGVLKKRGKHLLLSWSYGKITRPGPGPGSGGIGGTVVEAGSRSLEEAPVLKVSPKNGRQASGMAKLARRICFLLDPQRTSLYGQYEALELCRRVRAVLSVQEVMEG